MLIKRHVVWNIPTEINFNRYNLPVTHSKYFSVSKAGLLSLAFIGDENHITVFDHVNELETFGCGTIWPANREIVFAIKPVVEWAGETKIFSYESFNRCAVFRDIGIVTRKSDGGDIFCHDHILMGFSLAAPP